MLLRLRSIPIILILACIVLPAVALGQEGSAAAGDEWEPGRESGLAGHGSLEIRVGYYHNDDGKGDGNPFLDEELTVIEPVIIFDYNVTDKLGVNASFSYDQVSSASIERLHRFPEQSGASGDYAVDLAGDYIFRSDGIDQILVAGGWRWSF